MPGFLIFLSCEVCLPFVLARTVLCVCFLRKDRSLSFAADTIRSVNRQDSAGR